MTIYKTLNNIIFHISNKLEILKQYLFSIFFNLFLKYHSLYQLNQAKYHD